MIRLALKLAFAGAALWAVWTFVPIKGRTLAQRWTAAGSASAFIERGWAEITRDPAKPQARTQKPPAARERPTEGHTDADRRTIDRILSEHLPERR